MHTLLWLLYSVGLVAAGGGGNGGDGWKTTTSCTTEYWTKGYTSVVTVDDWTKTMVPYPVTQTEYVPSLVLTTIEGPPVTYKTTETVKGPPMTHQTTETVEGPPGPTVVVTETSLSLSAATDYLTSTAYVTSLVQAPIVTVYITTTTVEISIQTIPPSTVTATEITTTSECDFCKIDIYAKALRFPTSYIYSPIYAKTYDIYKTVYGPGSTVYSTDIIYRPTTCLQPPVTTWVAFGVVLTSPTTYLAYTNFSHGFLEARPTVYGCGELVSEVLELGPAGTEYAELILPTNIVPSSPTPAPSQLLLYLDSLPTVVAQLSGVPAISCDTPKISTVSTFDPQETAVAGTTVDDVTTQYQPAQYVFAENASSAASTTAIGGGSEGSSGGATESSSASATDGPSASGTDGSSTETAETSEATDAGGNTSGRTPTETGSSDGTSSAESTPTDTAVVGGGSIVKSTASETSASGSAGVASASRTASASGSAVGTLTNPSQSLLGGSEGTSSATTSASADTGGYTVTRTVTGTTSVKTVTVSQGVANGLSSEHLLFALLPSLLGLWLC